jgi:hypothetical protein
MSHNYEAQRRETFETFVQAAKDKMKLPKESVVDFLFLVEEADANWAGAEKALKAKGFRTQRDMENDLLVASCGPLPITPEAIWAQERVATEIAIAFDFYPDGWDLGVED